MIRDTKVGALLLSIAMALEENNPVKAYVLLENLKQLLGSQDTH